MSDPLIAAELAAIRERESNATPGPWLHLSNGKGGEDDPCLVGHSKYIDHPTPITCGTPFWSSSDFDFIAAARTDIPRLLATIGHLAAVIHEACEDMRKAKEPFIGCNAQDALFKAEEEYHREPKV